MKKKVALSATAIAVLASTVPTQVAPVEAAADNSMDVVYVDFSKAGNNTDDFGAGVQGNEFTQLTTALQKVKPNGTIIITGEAFVNDTNSNSAPWYINKNVTIKSEANTPPVIDIRKGGIVLGANVKFENVVLNMPNINCNDIFANGHKLELLNVATVGRAGKDIDIYAGALTTATSPSGSLGHVVINTDGNFKTPQYSQKVTKLGAIYAGSSSGQSDIESLIEVNTPYVASTVSIGTIYGRGTGGQVNNADVNIKLNGLLFPAVDGYTGSSAKTNVEVINQATSGKSFDFLNINKLTLTRGEIQVRNNQLANIPEVHLATGTTLNLKYAAPEVTIGTYTGDGIVIVPKTGLLNVTNGVTGSNNLELAVDFYFSNASDKAEENHVYVITPKGSNIDFTPASSQSAYGLYAFEEDSQLKWKFVHNSNKPVEPEEPEQPTPEPPTTTPTDPVVTNATFTSTEQTVTNDSAFVANYEFSVTTEDGRALTSPFTKPFTFAVGDKQAVYQEATDTYRIEDLGLTFRVVQLTGDNQFQLIVSGNSQTLSTGNNPITVGIKDKVFTKDLSLIVEQPTPPPTPPTPPTDPEPEPEQPEVQEPTVTRINVSPDVGVHVQVRNEDAFEIASDLIVSTEGDLEVDVNQFNFTLDDLEAKPVDGQNGVYTFEDKGITLTVTSTDTPNKFRLVVSGDSMDLPLGMHHLYTQVEGHNPKGEMYLDILNASIRITKIDIKSPGKVETDITNPNLYIPFTVEANREFVFSELGYTFTLNGEEPRVVNRQHHYYDKLGIEMQVTAPQDGTFNFYITKTDRTPLDAGTYTFAGTAEGREDINLSFEVELPPARVYTYTNGQPTVTKTVKANQINDGVKLEHVFVFNHPGHNKVDLGTLDYKVTIDDKVATYADGVYTAEGTDLKFTLTPKGDGKYEGHLFTDNGTIPVGEHTVNFEHKEGFDSKPFGFKVTVENPSTPTPGGSGSGSSTPTPEPVDPPTPPTPSEPDPEEPTPPTTDPEDKEEEEEEKEPTNPPSTDGGNNGGTTTEPTNPPSGGSTSGGNNGGSTSGGNTGGSSSGGSTGGNTGGGSSTGGTTPPPSTGGGTTLPAPDPKPEKPTEKPPVVEQPTPVPPQQEETKPTTRPTVKPGAIASAVEALEQLSTTIKEKVDSLLTEVIEQAKGLVLDLTGDKDDLSSVSTLEVTGDGVFANVDGERVKFASDLKLNDMSKLRITRADGSPIPYKTDGAGFTITTHNFSDILITERVVEPFVDVAKDAWFQPYVDEMYNRGITTGTTATTFNPNASITRAQLAALLARTYELKPTGEKPVLTDTDDKWYAADVQALVDLGIIKGYGDGTFRGDEPITREHLVVMLQRLAEKLGKDANPAKESNFTDTAKMSAEGKSAIQWAAEQGIINSGQGTAFKPKSDATRAQVAKMLTLFINK